MLYLFKSLPVKIPTKQFIEWDRLISRYLWQGKKPRVRYKTLQLRKESGDMGLPCLQEYYYAAQLRPLICLCTPTYSARRKKIESAIIGGIPIAAMIADNELQNKMVNKDNPWINKLLETWQETVKLCGIGDSVKLLRWCAYDSEFVPNRSDNRFQTWITKGLTNYYTFVHKGAFQSFENPKRENMVWNGMISIDNFKFGITLTRIWL